MALSPPPDTGSGIDLVDRIDPPLLRDATPCLSDSARDSAAEGGAESAETGALRPVSGRPSGPVEALRRTVSRRW
jgi:hypothetical protein